MTVTTLLDQSTARKNMTSFVQNAINQSLTYEGYPPPNTEPFVITVSGGSDDYTINIDVFPVRGVRPVYDVAKLLGNLDVFNSQYRSLLSFTALSSDMADSDPDPARLDISFEYYDVIFNIGLFLEVPPDVD
jgi:hypothetical protein